MKIPWKIKSAGFWLADRIGTSPLYFAQKFVTRRAKESIKRPKSSWVFHKENILAENSKVLFEFGAGKNLAQNIFLSDVVAQQIVVDLFPMLEIDLVNAAIRDLTAIGVETRGEVTSIEDIAAIYNISYRAPADAAYSQLPEGSVDAVVSTNTLEHIPRGVISRIWSEAFRILRPAGIVSSKIDYADHYAKMDKSISRLNFLTFSEREWQRYNHSCHFQNRLRHGHHKDLLVQAGFEIVRDFVESPVKTEGLALRTENLTGDPMDFSTNGYILARKPLSASQ
jgi:SAM-dependent methyltransferase